MKVFVVSIPLFDTSMSVAAYRLRDQMGDKLLAVKGDFRGMNDAWLSPGLDLVGKVGLEPFAADKPLFVDLNRMQLLMGKPTNLALPPEKLVCTIPGSIVADPEVLDHCATLKALGYPIALDVFPLNGIGSPFFPVADYLILDYKDLRFEDILKAVITHHPHVRIVVENVPDMDTFTQLGKDRDTRHNLFTGRFYSQPITKGAATISPLKVNALQLLRFVNEPDFELGEITKIIERDPALSISLLQFINSGALGLSRKVGSIQSAVAILGQQEVRRWATVAISVNLAEDRPSEITRISLIRAKFAENLALAFELGVFQNSLFLAGLFSLLDTILQRPMAEAIQEVAVEKRVQEALVEKKGDLYPVLELIYAYERADWNSVSILMIRSDISVEALSGAFVDAIVWYHQLLASIDQEEETLPEA